MGEGKSWSKSMLEMFSSTMLEMFNVWELAIGLEMFVTLVWLVLVVNSGFSLATFESGVSTEKTLMKLPPYLHLIFLGRKKLCI